jgi:hypothetical protein
VELPYPPGVEALHYTRDGAVPTAAHPRLEGPLVLAAPGVLRVRGYTGGRPVTAVATRQFWIGAPPPAPALMLGVDPALLHDLEFGILHNWDWQRRSTSRAAMESRALEQRPSRDGPGPGQLWEAVAHALVVERERVTFDGPVGLQRLSDDSLQIVARPSYGADAFPASLLEPRREPAPRRLAVDPQDIAWQDELAYELVRLGGGLAPRTRVVVALLNGKATRGPGWAAGLAVVKEVVDDRFVESRWEAVEFDLVKGRPLRVVLGSAEAFEGLVARLARPGWTLADLESSVDVPGLVALHFALAFTAPGAWMEDSVQGYLGFDRSRRPPFLRLIAWDADYSFLYPERDWLARWGRELRRRGHGYRSGFLPVLLVDDLLRRDPEFRARYLRHAERMLNHVYTIRWWQARQAAFGWAQQPAARATVERFMRERPSVMRRALSAVLGIPPPQPVQAAVSGPGRLLVDGVEQDGAYEGAYFAGGAVELDVPPASRNALRELTVNGAAVRPPYRLVVDRPLTVEARFSD